MQENINALEEVHLHRQNMFEGPQLRIVALEEANADLRNRMRQQ